MSTTERRRPRIRLPEDQAATLRSGSVVLPGSLAHYLGRVLRVRVGQEIELFDGAGYLALGMVQRVERGGVVLRVAEGTRLPRRGLRLVVGVAPPKGPRAEWLVEKLTEVGVDTIVWLLTRRSVTTPEPQSNKVSRWLRLADAAAAQCGRADVPALVGPESLEAFMARDLGPHRFVADPSGGSLSGEAPLGRAALLVGPEGGFTPVELREAGERGYTPLSLGHTILRTETAALVGSALLLSAG